MTQSTQLELDSNDMKLPQPVPSGSDELVDGWWQPKDGEIYRLVAKTPAKELFCMVLRAWCSASDALPLMWIAFLRCPGFVRLNVSGFFWRYLRPFVFAAIIVLCVICLEALAFVWRLPPRLFGVSSRSRHFNFPLYMLYENAMDFMLQIFFQQTPGRREGRKALYE